MEVILTEQQRQLILLALAKLSLERPTWMDDIKEAAAALDDDHLSNFTHFREIHSIHPLRSPGQ